MPKTLPGLTHALVTTVKDAKDMEAMKGTMAHVSLCLGPGDETAVHSISIKKLPGPVSRVNGFVPKTLSIVAGAKVWTPVLTGTMAEEAVMAALRAFDKVMSTQGLKFNKSYRVGKDVEEITA